MRSLLYKRVLNLYLGRIIQICQQDSAANRLVFPTIGRVVFDLYRIFFGAIDNQPRCGSSLPNCYERIYHFSSLFWAKWPRFAVCYHRQTDFTRACLPIFSLWVSIRHPRLDSEGVYCTPLTLNLLQEFLIPGYSPRCFFGRGSEGVSEKTENRSLLPSQPGRWDRGRFQLHPKSRVNM